MSSDWRPPGDGKGPERPRSEPEIIPPGGPPRSSPGDSTIFVGIDDGSGNRAYVARPGPFTTIMVLLIVGLIVAFILITLLGLVLIWIPFFLAILAVGLLVAGVRHYWRRYVRS